MALGDGTSWDETTPTDATTAVQIDDYNRDLRKGVRSRMAVEHEWPSSQAATSEAGAHKFITLQNQAAKPTLAGTQVAGVYVKTQNLYYENSAGTEVVIVAGTAVGDGKILVSSTDTTGGYIISKLGAGMTVSGTNVICAVRSFDYGESLSASTVDTLASVIFCRGVSTVNGSATISSLPFANATSYQIGLVRVNTYHTETPFATSKAAASFVINNANLGDVGIISWIAVGV